MKKKMLTIITAAACCMGAFPAIASSGASVSPETGISCLKGDANLDTKATLADSVAILQHIANRDKYGLSPQGLVNADVDGNEGVTASDALELQKRDSMGAPESSDDNASAAVYTTSIDWTMNHDGFIDNIWQRVSGGYNSVITSTEQLDIYLSQICTDEKKAEYAAKYDEAFFAENVLFINTLSQGMCARPLFTINSVDVGEKIKINAEWEDPQVGEAVMSVCVAQVVFPKSAYKTQAVEWSISTNVASPFGESEAPTYKKRVDYTFGYKGFKNENHEKLNQKGYAGVITSSDELQTYLSSVCTDEKIEEYAKLYDEKYFAEKVLFMDVIEQYAGARPCLYIRHVEFGDTITVDAMFNYSGAAEDIMSVCVGVIELSKENYKGQPVVWTCNDAPVSPSLPAYLSSSARVDWYCDTGTDMKPEVWDVLEKDNYSAVITSSAELEEYLSKIFQKDRVTEYLDDYNGFFEQCVLLVNCEIQTSGGKCRLYYDGAEYSEDGYSINITSSWDSEGDASVDMLSVCFEQVKVPKEQYSGQGVNWNVRTRAKIYT